jgi:hypothetical protein
MTFNHSPQALINSDLMEFTKAGFIDSDYLSDTNKLVTENTDFALYLDETTSYFNVLDKRNNEVWRSNPNQPDPMEIDPTQQITKSALEKQKSTLELTYFNHSGAITTINNYAYSIHHPSSILNDEGLRTYSIKYVPNGFQVLYKIEDLEIDYLYFPKFIKAEVLDNLENKDILKAIAYTGYDEERNLYEITQYESMSKLVKKRLYDTFYGENGLGYTREQAIAENTSYGYTDFFEKVRFEIGIQVSLTNDGVQISLLHDSIVEPQNVKLGSVSLYPLFGTAINTQDGYIVLPDGSGAIMNFNNGKYYQQPYNKDLYGDDLALLSHKMPEIQEKISLPLYGMIKKGIGGFAAVITAGDAMASLHADVSGRIDSYNKVFPSFRFRADESVTLGTGYNQYGIDLWTENRVNSDFTIDITFISDDSLGYVGIADIYRNRLIDEGLIRHDNTKNTVVTTEFLGAYDQKKFVLGIPYYHNEALTTYNQAQDIIEHLQQKGISLINVQYTGIMNGGLSTGVNDQFKLESSLGNKKSYQNFLDYLDHNNISFYPTLSLVYASEFNKMFDNYRYPSNRLDGSNSILFDYHLPSKLPYNETPYDNVKENIVISPVYLQDIYKDFDKDYDGQTIAFDLFGSSLHGDYSKNRLVYRQDALTIQKELLDSIDEKVLLQDPLSFAIPNAEVITDLPMETTLYAILDYPIPLVQLVLSGYVDYSTESLNLNNNRSTQYNFLKVLETGSNLKYTLTFEDSRVLKETQYNYYLSTQYDNWIDEISRQVTEMDRIGIHEGHLINHELLDNNVVRVTYSNGVSIIINYNLSDVIENGTTIPAMDYIVVGVN